MTNRWVYKPQPDQKYIARLSSEINVNPILSSILVQRGISNYDMAKSFFRPSLEQLFDPFLMKDMSKAVERINYAIKNDEKILIYGDYDVDGTTSVALVYDFLKQYHNNIDFYIPDRYLEGYGVSKKSINYAIKESFNLIISLDCGIKAVDKVAYAKDHGIDFIICDHHRPGEKVPDAYAVLDPKRTDCEYPFDELSGCGVGFKLMQAFCHVNEIIKEKIFDYLDLVAVSIASDIVPMTGENRVLAYYGLIRLNQNPRPGLKALIKVSGIRNTLDISSVVFNIGPRINAAGRIAHAKASVELLITENETEANDYATKINSHNVKRKDFDINTTQEAIEMIENDEKLRNAKSTVLYKKDWNKGVIGIVASRCIEKFYKPTIILTESNSKATGSARSVLGFDVYEAISECSDLLDQYGGHRYAAGLTMDIEKVDEFQKKFERVVNEKITGEQLIPQLVIDQKINFAHITQKFYNILKQMNPFGPENMSPVFATNNICAINRPTIMKDKHIKFLACDKDKGEPMPIIGFGFAQHFDKINSGEPFSIAYTIEENEYLGNTSIQLYLKDVKFD